MVAYRTKTFPSMLRTKLTCPHAIWNRQIICKEGLSYPGYQRVSGPFCLLESSILKVKLSCYFTDSTYTVMLHTTRSPLPCFMVYCLLISERRSERNARVKNERKYISTETHTHKRSNINY